MLSPPPPGPTPYVDVCALPHRLLGDRRPALCFYETFLFIYFFPCGKVCFSLAPGNNRSVSGMLFLSRPGSAAPGPRLAPRTRAWGPASSHTHSSASARGWREASLTTSYDGLLRLRVTLTSGPGLYSQKRYTVRGGGPRPAPAQRRAPPSPTAEATSAHLLSGTQW